MIEYRGINMKKCNIGIYKLINNINGDFYIGHSIHIRQRINGHFWLLSKGKHPNIHLQRAYNKYGKDQFVAYPLLYCDKEHLIYYEQLLVDSLIPQYNIAKECVSSTLGVKASEETKAKLRYIQRNRDNSKIFTPEVRKKISIASSKKIVSEETKKKLSKYFKENPIHCNNIEERNKKISNVLKGRIFTEEHKKNISMAAKKRPKRILSEAHRNKIGEANRKRIYSVETRRKLSIANKGKRVSDETKNRLSIAGKGRKHTEETKLKMSKARKLAWEFGLYDNTDWKRMESMA